MKSKRQSKEQLLTNLEDSLLKRIAKLKALSKKMKQN